MDVRVMLARPGHAPRRVLIRADADATVGEVATVLRIRDPLGAEPGNHPATLALSATGEGAVLDPATAFVDAGVRAGATISVVAARAVSTPARVDATLRVVSGPDAGREFPLGRGSALVGRGPGCDVRLSDSMVSKEHVRINVGDIVEVWDQNSANGVELGGELVARAEIRADDVVTIGDTAFSVIVHGTRGAQDAAPDAAHIDFNRPPRVAPDHAGETLEAPEPPSYPEPQPLPILPMILPLLMGVVLYFVTFNLLSIIFVALSPLLMLGSYLEGRKNRKKEYERRSAEYRDGLRVLGERSAAALSLERAGRLAEQPATAEFVDALKGLQPLLWCRHPDQSAFLRLRLGLGEQAARLSISRPSTRNGAADLVAELDALIAAYRMIDAVPVTADLREVGHLGVAGGSAPDVARAVVVQAVLAHSPAELAVCVIGSGASAADWDWLTWIPHTVEAAEMLGVASMASTSPGGLSIVGALSELVDRRRESSDRDQIPAMLLVVSDDAPVPRPALIELASRGREAGVHLVWVADSVARLPALCHAFVETPTRGGPSRAGFVVAGENVVPLEVEACKLAEAEDIGRRLAPMLDAGYERATQADLPTSVTYLAVAGTDLAVQPDVIVDRWREGGSLLAASPGHGRRREGTLRALVGTSASEHTFLDLRSQGPHALVGGTTGSGKSEFLQTWVLSMAASHSPQRVTFLLVDYKGGSAFADCVRLPHTVGLVTDLSPHLVRRALTSLNAELRHREHILNAKRAKDLIELERTGDPETPPSLVVVIDEFAALVAEVPEFIDGVVNIAQRGRSLGIHLILATQRPAGVIKDNLRANTNLRVALRMADEGDSDDVLGTRLAAGFDPSIPGRAAAKTGPGRITTFQAAYVGGFTAEGSTGADVTVFDLPFGGPMPWPVPDEDAPAAVERRSDIRRVVDTIGQANTAAGLAPARKPWLPELAAAYDLAVLPTRRTDTEMVFGVADDPEAQAQPVVSFVPDRDGSMIVFGTGGTGKSTFLRTIAITAGLTARGGPCQVYGLDFGSRGLTSLEVLPHVGSIILGDDEERLTRLVRTLRALIDERARAYSKANAGTITEYRALAQRPEEPRILLLIDGLGAFRQAYEIGQRSRWFDMVQSIATDGRPVGVHVIVSADRPGAVPSGLASSLQRSLVLRLASEMDEALLGLPRGILNADSPAGRGVVDGQEVQVAVLGRDASASGQAAALALLAESMTRAGVPAAPEIQSLPERVTLSSLPASVGGRPTLGLADETLSPIGFPDTGVLLVSGPPRSGRTTVLATLVESVRRASPDRRLVYLGSNRSPLRGLLPWSVLADTPDDVADVVATLAAEIGEGRVSGQAVIVIEAIPDFLNSAADLPLQDLIKVARSHDHLVIADGETTALAGSWPLLQAVKSARTGIALQPDQLDGDTIFRTPFPRVSRAEFPPGRGLLVGGGRADRVQVAVPE